MYQKNIQITTKNGIHTRPLAVLVKEAQAFTSDINIISNHKTANAKSIFNLQTLNLSEGVTLTISASGDDEIKAVSHIIKLISELE